MPRKKYEIVVRRERGDVFATLRRAFGAEAVRWDERQGDRRLATVVIQVDRRRQEDRRGRTREFRERRWLPPTLSPPTRFGLAISRSSGATTFQSRMRFGAPGA